MKIGILTYHHSFNYGAILQSYATAKTLKKLGCDVEFINIRQSERRSLIGWLYLYRKIRYKAFMQKHYPPETKLINSLDELKAYPMDYDCLLVGSDQTWNPLISKEKCLAYFLDFGDLSTKRISYASSFGFSEWPSDIQHLKPSISKALLNFTHISIRERSGKKILTEEFGLDSTLVVDPTMLIDSYEDITGKIISNNMVCCYILNRTPSQLSFAKKIGEIFHKKPVLINNILPVSGFVYKYPPSIEKWLKYIGGAEIVITDSFHGVVFSLIYHRNFVVITPNTDRISRLRDLLLELDLENRFFTDSEKAYDSKIWQKPINYDYIDKKIKKMRDLSLEYLSNSLFF